MDCPVKFCVRNIYWFTSYKVTCNTKHNREKATKFLREDLKISKEKNQKNKVFRLLQYLVIQFNSCNSNPCNLKDHLNWTNSSVPSKFTSKPLQENSFSLNSHNSKNHLNWTNFESPGRIFHHVIQILVSESSFFILRFSNSVISNVLIRVP